MLNRERDAKKPEFPNWKMSLLRQIPDFQVATDKKTVAIKIIDIENNQATYFYPSISQASKALFSEFHATENANTAYSTIYRKLEKREENILYRGRFIFEYATDEEVKKYFEDNKAS